MLLYDSKASQDDPPSLQPVESNIASPSSQLLFGKTVKRIDEYVFIKEKRIEKLGRLTEVNEPFEKRTDKVDFCLNNKQSLRRGVRFKLCTCIN